MGVGGEEVAHSDACGGGARWVWGKKNLLRNFLVFRRVHPQIEDFNILEHSPRILKRRN